MRKKRTYKVVDLFGNEETRIVEGSGMQKNLFSDYEGFVEKFEEKKTTDDCYTPDEVYRVVLNYVAANCEIDDKQIIRPFYPGGDYEHIDYPDDCVVIDNPPFSIISQIVRFYLERDIKFFLFAPHLTNFGSDINCTHIIASANIVYENGANVKTSFLSNLFGDIKIIGSADLYKELEEIRKSKKNKLPKYKYPDNIVTVSKVSYCVENGVPLQIHKKDVLHYRQMDAQKVHKKALFGSGFIVSDQAAKILTDAENQAALQAKKIEDANLIVWELSEREKEIIKELSRKK